MGDAEASISPLQTGLEEAAALAASLASSCNAVMQAEAHRGRELLKKIAACRRSADKQLLDLWELAMTCPETRQTENADFQASVSKAPSEATLLSTVLQDIIELRARTEEEVACLEAEASKAAAACAEARAFREEAESQGREHMKLLKMRLVHDTTPAKMALRAHGSRNTMSTGLMPESSWMLSDPSQLESDDLPGLPTLDSQRRGLDPDGVEALPADSFWLPGEGDGQF